MTITTNRRKGRTMEAVGQRIKPLLHVRSSVFSPLWKNSHLKGYVLPIYSLLIRIIILAIYRSDGHFMTTLASSLYLFYLRKASVATCCIVIATVCGKASKLTDRTLCKNTSILTFCMQLLPSGHKGIRLIKPMHQFSSKLRIFISALTPICILQGSLRAAVV